MQSIRTLIAAGCCLSVFGVCAAAAWNDDIEGIMERGFKKGGLRHQIFTEVEKDKPDWSGLQKKSKEFKDLCDKLAQQKPPKGELGSWKTHTQLVAAEAKTLCDCASSKDQAKAKLTLKKINDSCAACHEAHRE